MKQVPELYIHQRKYLEDHGHEAYHALFWEPRTGKSKAIIHNVDMLRESWKISCAIIVAPNIVHLQWAQEEIPKHSTYERNQIYVWDTQKVKRPEELRRIKDLIDSDVFVWFVFATTAVISDHARAIFRRITKKRENIFLCVDESHNYSSPSSKRGQMMRAVAKRMEYKRILTGTPIHNNPLHLWAQYELLEPGLLGHRTYGEFLGEYTKPLPHNVPRYVKPKLINLDNLWENAAKYATQLEAKDCMDLSIVNFRRIVVPMHPKQLKACQELLKVKTTSHDEYSTTVNHIITMLQSLQKISSGFIVDEETRKSVDIIPFAELPKLTRIEDELPFAEGNIIIWAWYKHDIKRLYAHFKKNKAYDVYWMGGGMDVHDKKKVLDRINDGRGKQKILIAQPIVAGTGLTYTAIETTFWFSQTMDGIIREQANARGQMIGGSPITIIDLECGYADDKILQNHIDKKTLVDDFINVFEDMKNAYLN